MLTDEQLDDLALRHASALTASDGLILFARAVEAAEREACAVAVRDEPELPGEIPQAMFEVLRHDKDACAEALRILVRTTKTGILERIEQRSNVEVSGLRSKSA